MNIDLNIRNMAVMICDPDGEAVTMAQLINNPELDIEKSLTELSQRYNDGLYEQAKIDTEKQQNRMLRSDFRSR